MSGAERRRLSPLHYPSCTIDLDQAEVLRGGEREVLSPMETRLLRYLFERLGRNVSLEELLREVWGYRARRETRAVALTVSRLRRKLGDGAEHPQVLINVPRAGYRLSPPLAEGAAPCAELLALVEQPLLAHRAQQLRRRLPELLAQAEEAEPERCARLLVGAARYAFVGALSLEPLPLWRAAARQQRLAPRLRCWMMAVRLTWRSGALREGLQAVEEELQRCATSPEVGPADVELEMLICELRVIRVNLLAMLGQGDRALEAAQAELEVARRLGGRSLEALLLDRQVTILIHQGEALHARAVQLMLDVEDLLLRDIEPWVAGRLAHNLGTDWYHLGRAGPAIHAYRRAVAWLEEMGAESDAAQAQASLASCLLSQGQAEEALRLTDAAVETQRRMGLRGTEASARVVRGRALAALGHLDEAVEELERAVHIASLVADNWLHVVAGLDLALLLWRLGRPEEALPLALRAEQRYREGLLVRRATSLLLLARLEPPRVSAEEEALAREQLQRAATDPRGPHAALWAGPLWLLEAPERAGGAEAAALGRQRSESGEGCGARAD